MSELCGVLDVRSSRGSREALRYSGESPPDRAPFYAELWENLCWLQMPYGCGPGSLAQGGKENGKGGGKEVGVLREAAEGQGESRAASICPALRWRDSGTSLPFGGSTGVRVGCLRLGWYN